MPSEPAGTPLQARVKIKAYPCVERGGIVGCLRAAFLLVIVHLLICLNTPPLTRPPPPLRTLHATLFRHSIFRYCLFFRHDLPHERLGSHWWRRRRRIGRPCC